MRRLKEEDIEKFSVISGVPIMDLGKLQALGVLSEKAILDHLIRHDFHHIKKGGKFTTRQIKAAIQLNYQISSGKVAKAIYDKRQHEAMCQQCGTVTKKAELKRNGGICDTCVAKSIEL